MDPRTAAVLLETKLHIPRRRSELVARPRLLRRLTEGLRGKLTLVSAPAGFGKTTLLAQWIAACGTPVAWLSLDRDDNDPMRFWSYVIAALETVPGFCQADVGEAARAMLQGSATTAGAWATRPLMEALLTQLINGIAATSQSLTLVLDDLHLIDERQVHDALLWLLDRLPPPAHLLICTRADPPWPLARLRAQRLLTELRAEDLRFTLEEAASFLNGVIGLRLSPEDIAALAARTEGWIAGLQMAALSMRGHDDMPGFIRAFTGGHRFVLDYLVEEVLDKQPAGIRAFLLQTSILERMAAPLCDAVILRSDSRSVLSHLEQANLFLVPLDDERRWYRYHHLFRDLLRSQLSQVQPDQVATLHRRASMWYEENGLAAEAVSHALAAGDVERVARLLEGRAVTTVDRTQLQMLLRWLEALPADAVRSRPWLCLTYAWALAYIGRLSRLESLLDDAERMSAGLPEAERDRVAGHAAAIRAYCSVLSGEAARCADYAVEALARLPAQDLTARSMAAQALSFAVRLGYGPPTARQTLTEVAAACQRHGDCHLALSIQADLALSYVSEGRLRQAMDLCREALALAASYESKSGRELPAVGCIYSRMGVVLREWNDLEPAVRYGRAAVERCRRWGLVEALADSLAFLALTLQSAGDAAGALAAIGEAKRIAAAISPWYLTAAEVYEARIRLAQGDVAAAASLAATWAGKHRVVSLRVLLAQGRPAEALELLAPLLEGRLGAGALGGALSLLALQALALHALQRTDQALALLERTLAQAEPEGHVRVFVDEGAPMAALLREFRRKESEGRRPALIPYVDRLLAAFGPEASPQGLHPQAGPAAAGPSPPMIEPLTERELQVLRLLATDLSTAEIAGRLFITVSTLRTHSKRIYGKLQAHSRMAAVMRARELDLL